MLKNLWEVISRFVALAVVKEGVNEHVAAVVVCPITAGFAWFESLIFCFLLGDVFGEHPIPDNISSWELLEKLLLWYWWWWFDNTDDTEEGGRLSAFLLLLLFEFVLFPLGGVESSKSGTTGDGEVIELKFENVEVWIACGDEFDTCCWSEVDVGVFCANIPTLSICEVESEIWCGLDTLDKFVDIMFVGASNSAGGWSVGFVGSSSSSKMQSGGWLGIWDILQCSKLLSISEGFGGKVTEYEVTNDGGVGESNSCSVSFWRSAVVKVLFRTLLPTSDCETFDDCRDECNWWYCWYLLCCDEVGFGKCW